MRCASHLTDGWVAETVASVTSGLRPNPKAADPVHAVAVSVLDELAADRPETRLRVDVLPPHLQQLAAALGGDETQSEPGAHVRILRVAHVLDPPDLLVRQHAVAARLFRRLLDADHRIRRRRNQALLRGEGEDARHECP
jgi:hypothetical protein